MSAPQVRCSPESNCPGPPLCHSDAAPQRCQWHTDRGGRESNLVLAFGSPTANQARNQRFRGPFGRIRGAKSCEQADGLLLTLPSRKVTWTLRIDRWFRPFSEYQPGVVWVFHVVRIAGESFGEMRTESTKHRRPEGPGGKSSPETHDRGDPAYVR